MSLQKGNSGAERGNVKLDREHTHAGIIHPVGSIVENLRPDQIERLESQKIGKRTTEKPVAAGKS
jgi:hypothetical protein